MFGVGVLLLILTMITCPKLAPEKVTRLYDKVTRICNRSKHSLLTSKSPKKKKEEGKRDEEDVEDDSTDEDDSINLVH